MVQGEDSSSADWQSGFDSRWVHYDFAEEAVMTHAVIRFVGEPGEAYYYLKLGPMDNPNPPEREFQGGDEINVQIQPTAGKLNCVDLTFEDEQVAIEVPRDFFVIVRETDGR
jgi:hypothetical protein